MNNTDMSHEKRKFSRVPFNVEAEMTVNNVLYKAATINNLSIGGCLLPVEGDFEVGAPCTLRILMSGTSSELSVGVSGKVLRSALGEVAIKFDGIGVDSLFHLRNIVRHNASDPEAVEREILFQPGLL